MTTKIVKLKYIANPAEEAWAGSFKLATIEYQSPGPSLINPKIASRYSPISILTTIAHIHIFLCSSSELARRNSKRNGFIVKERVHGDVGRDADVGEMRDLRD